MSAVKYLADEDLRQVIVTAARRAEPSLVFVRVQDVGLAGAPDDRVLAFAAAEGAIAVSHDVNTMTVAAANRLAAGESMAGLLLVPQSRSRREVVESLVLIWAATDAAEWVGRIAFLPI